MTSVLKKSRGAKGKSVSMQEDLPSRWEGSQRRKSEEVADLIKFIDESVVGKGNSFCGPYGRRKGGVTHMRFSQDWLKFDYNSKTKTQPKGIQRGHDSHAPPGSTTAFNILTLDSGREILYSCRGLLTVIVNHYGDSVPDQQYNIFFGHGKSGFI
ncbi:hypothetical protein EVAR_19333_1 [Eumeta japonica]|uniref:Uncharacterized protein n=1 Tax=Eumeta variegata TaxID=151549 RepID=A0A4C1TRB1_EUMVA|nr:hypothetical protein EVAR_19333_1 [Eumeta japonica]